MSQPNQPNFTDQELAMVMEALMNTPFGQLLRKLAEAQQKRIAEAAKAAAAGSGGSSANANH